MAREGSNINELRSLGLSTYLAFGGTYLGIRWELLSVVVTRSDIWRIRLVFGGSRIWGTPCGERLIPKTYFGTLAGKH